MALRKGGEGSVRKKKGGAEGGRGVQTLQETMAKTAL